MASFSSSSSSSSNLFILVLPILLLLSSLPSLTVADGEEVRPVPRSDVTKTITCMELLMRCQYQLRDPHPTSACCAPLNYTVTHDIQCLCSLSFNEDMLLYLNITFQNILTLPERCAMEMPDLTFCANYDPPKMNFDTLKSVSSEGPSTHRVGFRKISASTVAMFIISWMQFFPHVH